MPERVESYPDRSLGFAPTAFVRKYKMCKCEGIEEDNVEIMKIYDYKTDTETIQYKCPKCKCWYVIREKRIDTA